MAPNFRVRTVTLFVKLPTDEVQWEPELAAAGRFLARAQAAFEALGLEVQTLRIATQPLDLFLGAPGPALAGAARRLEALAHRCGVPMMSLGGVTGEEYLPWLPPLLAATSTVSCSFALPPAEPPCGELARRVAAAALQVAAITDGRRNFGFAAAINCGAAGIPFFPVASATDANAGCFAIGIESDGILADAWASAAAANSAAAAEAAAAYAAAAAGGGGADRRPPAGSPLPLAAAESALTAALLAALAPVEATALALELGATPADCGAGASAGGGAAATAAPAAENQGGVVAEDGAAGLGAGAGGVRGYRYLGLDTSIAPGLDTPPMTSSFERLGYGRFGGPGTLAACGAATRALKAVPLRLTGYCGLMLAVCEDHGLAAAAAAGGLSVAQLLQWSAACGCGLDTVPVPGPGPRWADVYADIEPGAPAVAAGGFEQAQGEAESRGVGDGEDWGQSDDYDFGVEVDEVLLGAFAGVIMDTALLACRLRKPLAVRLLPLPGKLPGDATGFDNPYLINSSVMALV